MMYCHKLIRLYALIIIAYCTTRANAVHCQVQGSNITSSCYCHKVTEHQTPWSNGAVDTAPAARNASLSFFYKDGMLFPRISWTVSAQYLQFIDGFYIEVILLESEYKYFNCTFNASRVERLRQRSRVSFHFKHCCYRLFGGLYPGDNVHSLIISLPLYSNGDRAYYVTAERTAPEVQETTYATEELDYSKPTTDYSKPTTSMSTNITRPVKEKFNYDSILYSALISLATVLFITAVVTILLCLSRKWKRSNKGYISTSMPKRVLFISDEGLKHITLYNSLIESIKKSCIEEIEIVANIRRQNETASCSIIPWITKNMRNSDVVVIVISKQAQLDNATTETKSLKTERSTVAVALNVVQSEAVQCNFEIMRRRFVTLHIGGLFEHTDLVSYCTHYVIPKQLGEAMKHILGANYNTSFKIDDVAASILNQMSVIYDSSDNESHDIEIDHAIHSNDLNQSLIDSPVVDMNDLDQSVMYSSIGKTDNDESIDNNLSLV